MIDQVNQDLQMLGHYALNKKSPDYDHHYYNWEGIAVNIIRIPKKNYLRVDLSNLSIPGIIFSHPPLNEITEAKSEEEALSNLRNTHPGLTISFENAELSDAQFENLVFRPFNFHAANLKHASLKGSVLTQVIFEETKMQNADLRFCYGTEVYFEFGSRSAPAVHFNHADLMGANLCRSNFNKAKFIDTMLDHSNLSESKFEAAIFPNSTLKGAILAQANFSNADFTANILTSCNATGAIFRSAKFYNANLSDVIFTEADLQGANFKNATMNGALLNHAHFDLAQFSREQVLSFHYEDPHARAYINAIYEYMEKYQDKKDKHKEGFVRAEALIYSFINHDPYDANGENLLLKNILESSFTMFNSALRAGLLAVHERIQAAVPVVIHMPSDNKPK